MQGRIYSTTCTVQTPGDGTSIALEEVTTQALHDARSFPVSPKEFTINVSCSSPSNWHEVTGKFTTDGEIEGSNFSVHLKIRLPIRLAQNMSAYKLKIKLPILLLISSATRQFTLTLAMRTAPHLSLKWVICLMVCRKRATYMRRRPLPLTYA